MLQVILPTPEAWRFGGRLAPGKEDCEVRGNRPQEAQSSAPRVGPGRIAKSCADPRTPAALTCGPRERFHRYTTHYTKLPRSGDSRGTFNDPNVLGAFLILPIILLFQRVMAGRRVVRSGLALLIMLPAAVSDVLSRSMGAARRGGDGAHGAHFYHQPIGT